MVFIQQWAQWKELDHTIEAFAKWYEKSTWQKHANKAADAQLKVAALSQVEQYTQSHKTANPGSISILSLLQPDFQRRLGGTQPLVPLSHRNKSPETRHMELTAGKCCTVLTQSHQAPTLKHHSLSGIDVCSYWPQKIKKCGSAYEPVTRKNPIQQSESNLWGEAHFRYSVVLANGLSELHPSSFELRLTEKYSRYFENISPIQIRVSFHKSKQCRTDTSLFSSQLWSLHMWVSASQLASPKD